MKFLQKIANGIMVILILLVLFILYLQTNPSLSEQLGDALHKLPFVSTRESVSGNDVGISSTDAEQDISSPAWTISTPDESGQTGHADIADHPISETGLAQDIPASDYVTPDQTKLQIPSDMEGKSGYEPVHDEGIEISGDSAQSLLEEYGYGETGEGLTFDAITYPYYAMLDENLQFLYRQIYANAQAVTSSFVPLISVSGEQLKTAYTAMINDHPELFWMNTAYSYQYDVSGHVALISLSYNSTANQLDVCKAAFDQQVQSLLSAAETASTDYEKEVAIHDALIAHTSYRSNADMSQSAYSAIVNGETVCAGYAKAMQYLLQEMDVTVYYCTGYAGENHAWNIVSLDDGYYNLDATWDDSDPVNFKYFNGSDSDFSTDHARTDLSVYLPACNGEQFRLLRLGESTGSAVRSLQDAGLQQSDVITSLADYEKAASDALSASTENPTSFTLAVSDETLLKDIQQLYRSGNYQNVYGTEVISKRGASSMHVAVNAEKLTTGEYLLKHVFEFS